MRQLQPRYRMIIVLDEATHQAIEAAKATRHTSKNALVLQALRRELGLQTSPVSPQPKPAQPK